MGCFPNIEINNVSMLKISYSTSQPEINYIMFVNQICLKFILKTFQIWKINYWCAELAQNNLAQKLKYKGLTDQRIHQWSWISQGSKSCQWSQIILVLCKCSHFKHLFMVYDSVLFLQGYTNCSCVAAYQGANITSTTVKSGKCNTTCNILYFFLPVLLVAIFFRFVESPPSLSITLR